MLTHQPVSPAHPSAGDGAAPPRAAPTIPAHLNAEARESIADDGTGLARGIIYAIAFSAPVWVPLIMLVWPK